MTDGSSQPNMIRDGLAELARLRRQANGSPEIDEQPASTASYRQRMVEIYKEHNPAQLDSVDKVLSKYEGREQHLLTKMEAKYCLDSEAPLA